MNGSSLLATCENDDRVSEAFCNGYISAVADAVDADRSACLPDEVTRGQLRDIAIGWLRAHPETRHYAAAKVVATAFAEEFPCQ